MAFGEMGFFVVSCVKVRWVRELRSPRRAGLCCAVLCLCVTDSLVRFVPGWFVGSFVQVGWFVRPFVQVLSARSLARSPCCCMQDE